MEHDEGADELNDDLDEDFPLGDGTAETSAVVYCPYCSEPVEITLDAGSGGNQEYVEDCEVCCKPWQVTVEYDRAGRATVSVAPADD